MYRRTSGLGRFGMGDAASVKAQITSTAQQYGIDPNLALAVAQQESGFQQTGSNGGTLTSSAGALGVMQLMPATAAGLNVNPNDQTGNITGGVKLLSQLLSQFNGNVPLALAAYNSGAGNVQKYGGIPPFPETQNYVSSIMANYQSMGGSASISVPDSSSASSSPDTSSSGLDLASYLPSSISDLIPDDTQIAVGGVVLSESDLIVLGLATVGSLLLFSIL